MSPPPTKDALHVLGTVERLPTPVPFHRAHLSTPPLSRSPSPPADVDETLSALPTPTEKRSKTLSFFSSTFSKKLAPPEIRVPPPRTTPPPPIIDNSTNGEVIINKQSNYTNTSSGTSATGSANSSFFFSPPSFNRPTPPPSVRSTRSSTSHDEDVGSDDHYHALSKRADTLPPLHRFFPSRHSRPPSTSSREFVELDSGSLGGVGGGSDWNFEGSNFNARDWDTSPLPSPTSSSNHGTHHNFITEEAAPVDSPLSPPTPPPKDMPLPSSMPPAIELKQGVTLTLPTPPESFSSSSPSSVYKVTLIKLLGQGAFSSVWLAKDGGGKLIRAKSVKKGGQRRRSNARPIGGVLGLRPGHEWPRELLKEEEESGFGDDDWIAPLPQLGDGVGRHVSIVLRGERDGPGASSLHSQGATPAMPPFTDEEEDLIALKCIRISICQQPGQSKDMSRISVAHLREISILSRISHPSIISFLGSFESAGWYVLALPYITGGELFESLNDDQNYFAMTEPVVRRIWTELVRAVGWCHGVGLVHRDVKLENILLTTNPFQPNATLPPLSTPLIKLTDFNLARFIDPLHPLLTTKCGSESYAAPEIVLGRPYDGRETDSWACGIVLYGMVCRDLPFAAPKSKIATEEERRRREELMNIARVAYTFPQGEHAPRADLLTPELKRVVERLLVWDPSKRSSMLGIWEEAWLNGEGGVGKPVGAKIQL